MIKKVTLELIERIPEVQSLQSNQSNPINNGENRDARLIASKPSEDKREHNQLDQNANNFIASGEPARLIKIDNHHQTIEEEKKEEVNPSPADVDDSASAAFDPKLRDVDIKFLVKHEIF